MGTADLSKTQLQRMHRVLSRHVERKDMPGLVALVSHGDCVHVETLGTLALDNPAPVRRDTTFRIASLSEGRSGQEQILSPASVELMTSDHLTAEQRAGAELFFGQHSSWGFGDGGGHRAFRDLPRTFGWSGGLGTTAYTDPTKHMIGILLTQRMMDSPELPKVFTDFWTLAYGALPLRTNERATTAL